MGVFGRLKFRQGAGGKNPVILSGFLVLFFLFATADAATQGHPLSQIRTVDTNLNMSGFNVTNTNAVGIGMVSPLYPLDVSGAGRVGGNLYLGTAGRYLYDTGSLTGFSGGILLGGNINLNSYSLVSAGWLNGTNINATGIYGATLYESGTSLSSKYALQSTTISPGSGLSGGGDLSAARTLSIAGGGVTNTMIAANSVNKTQISGVLDSTVVGSLYGENITQGTIASARVSGVYSSITGIGTQAQNLNMGGNNLTNYNYLYSNDSAKLNGQSSSYYLDTSSTAQTKSGSLTVSGAWLNATNLNVSSNAYFGGNVGIGTTNPNLAALTIERDMTNAGETSAFTQVEIRGKTNSTLELLLGYNTQSDYGYIQANNYGIGGKNLVIQKYGGNVGIGTASPSSKLEVAGTLNATSGGSSMLLDANGDIKLGI